MKTSERGLELIVGFEGYRANWYDDGAGVLTIGFGHTGKLPKGFHAPLSADEALDLLVDYDLPRYEKAVTDLVRVPISQNEFDALVSLCYNIGVRAFRDSTLLARLNEGQYNASAFQFEKWVYAGGGKMRGLVRRRNAEKGLFLATQPADRIPRGPYAPSPYIDGLKRAKAMPPENIQVNVNTDLPTKQSGKAAA